MNTMKFWNLPGTSRYEAGRHGDFHNWLAGTLSFQTFRMANPVACRKPTVTQQPSSLPLKFSCWTSLMVALRPQASELGSQHLKGRAWTIQTLVANNHVRLCWTLKIFENHQRVRFRLLCVCRNLQLQALLSCSLPNKLCKKEIDWRTTCSKHGIPVSFGGQEIKNMK